MSKIVDEIKKIIKAEIETDGQGDFWSFGRGPQKVSDFIESKKESITINDIDKILKYFCSDSLCPAYFTHIILKNFSLKIDFIEYFLKYCAAHQNNGEGFSENASIIVNWYSEDLTSNAILSLIEFGDLFKNKVIDLLSKNNLVNSKTNSGLTLTETLVLQKNYRLALECARRGGDFSRLLIACPQIFNDLRPSFFCSKNHNDIQLKKIIAKSRKMTSFNLDEFKPIFESIKENHFTRDALVLLAKNKCFKQRILDYADKLSVAEQRAFLNSCSQEHSPFYTIYETPRGKWRTPNPSHGFQKKILDRYITLDDETPIINLEEKKSEISEINSLSLKK